MRRRRGPTLFPYTTLFRSRKCATWWRCWAAATTREAGPRDAALALAGARAQVAHRPAADPRRALPRGLGHPPERGDRKSTRLNSSHITISYAVFCLKKKKV